MADEIKTEQSFTFPTNQKYILFKTFRKSGVAVPAIVWFANDQDKLYVTTPQSSGKVKRIRNNQRALVAPCDSRGKTLGEEVEGQAHVLSADKSIAANAVLAHKYGLLYRVFMFASKIRKTHHIIIEIVHA